MQIHTVGGVDSILLFVVVVCVLYNSDLFDPRSGKWLLPMDKDFLWGHG